MCPRRVKLPSPRIHRSQTVLNQFLALFTALARFQARSVRYLQYLRASRPRSIPRPCQGTSKTARGELQRTSGSTKPRIFTLQPTSGSTKPRVFMFQPTSRSTKPRVFTLQPTSRSTKPCVFTLQPTSTTTEHRVVTIQRLLGPFCLSLIS